MFIRKIAGGMTAILFGAALAATGATPGRVTLSGHVPAAAAALTATGQLSATNTLSLAIGLPLRNQEQLTNLLRELYDPASTNFHKFITPPEFTARFGPTEADYAAVRQFAESNGFTVTGTHSNRVVLDVRAQSGDVERAFHVKLRTYRHPQEARSFYAPDAEPSVATGLPVLQVSGLDNYATKRPMSKVQPLTTGATPSGGSGPYGGLYIGNDFRNAYVPGTPLTGAGQSVALVQYDGYYPIDITNYIATAGITTSVVLTNIPINGGVDTPGSDNLEVCLDIEMAISMAPGLDKIIVYEASGSTAWSAILSRIANDNLARQISCSWGGGGPDATSEQIFQQMAAQGQSFFNASGDTDALIGTAPFPMDSPHITIVGGTTLTMNGSGASYASETVWNDRRTNPNGGDWGSSGGVSTYYSIPTWQQSVNMTANQGSTTMRNMPDVAMTATGIYLAWNNGQSGGVEGTSCAAPLWAGFLALVNQQAALASKPPVGFINPVIYALAATTNYSLYFHDTTTGDNTWPSSLTNYYAVTGYDLCTGLGTPNGTNLINALANVAEPLDVLPYFGFAASGAVGGPFVGNAQTFTLTNAGAGSLNWSLINTSAWLAVSSTGGTLAAAGQSSVTVNLSPVAINLPSGSYSGAIIFSNQTTGSTQSRNFSLQPGQSLVQNGGFENGDFSPWVLVGDTISDGFDYNAIVDLYTSPVVHSGTYGAFLGDTNLATLSQTLPTYPGQDYVLSFWVNDLMALSGGDIQQFTVNWITNATGTNTLLNLTVPSTFDWANYQFVVTATSTNTTLQFAVENTTWAFGLDDVSLTPIPAPTVTALAKATDSLTFTWNSLAGLTYLVQYKTNLLQPDWITLTTNTATDITNTFTASPSGDARRFYRIRRLP